MDKPVSILKFSIDALGLVIVFNLTLPMLLKISITSISVSVAAGVGALVGAWFAASVGRAPSRKERTLFLWLYGGSIVLIFAFIFLKSSRAFTLPGLVIVSLHALAYPAFAQYFLSEKRMNIFLRGRA